MKKFMYGLLSLICFMPLIVKAEPVKVYVFEAGGCPACEAQYEYLESLDSYNEKFIIVKKELYVDHVDFAHGKDYDLAVKVAQEFRRAGFGQASYSGTPFVVISDIYAATGANGALEKVIDEAYKEGDKDAVACIEAGNKDCVPNNFNIKTVLIAIGAIVIVFGGIVVVTLLKENKSHTDKDENNEETEKAEEKKVLEVKEEKEKEVKPKTTSKKKTSKSKAKASK